MYIEKEVKSINLYECAQGFTNLPIWFQLGATSYKQLNYIACRLFMRKWTNGLIKPWKNIFINVMWKLGDFHKFHCWKFNLVVTKCSVGSTFSSAYQEDFTCSILNPLEKSGKTGESWRNFNASIFGIVRIQILCRITCWKSIEVWGGQTIVELTDNVTILEKMFFFWKTA